MNAPARWHRVRSMLEDVVDRSPDERRSYLARACESDPDVRQEVESLLRAHDAAGRFLERPDSGATASAALPLTPALKPGTRLGSFEIEGTLGAGGMGRVYRARDTRLDRSVAIKTLSPALTADPRWRGHFEREARAISRLVHPHICVLLDIGRATLDEGRDEPFLVMELVEGETLDARLARGPLPLDQALQYAIQIAEALAAAHTHGIVHRDLKPSNIMLTTSGVKLLDFGLAGLRDPGPAGDGTHAGSVAETGPLAGTLPYMSPEQLRGEASDARSDLFAFGAVLFEMLTARPAFDAESPVGLIDTILQGDPPRLSEHQPLVPPAVDRLVGTCLSKDPAQRWQHAHDVAMQLKEVQAHRSETRPAPRRRRLGAMLGWTVATVALGALGLFVVLGMPVDSTNVAPRRLMFDAAPVRAGEAWTPIGSPDGRMVALLGGKEGGADGMFVHHLDTGVTRRLSGLPLGGCGWGVAWSVDGRSLIYQGGYQLMTMDVRTGSQHIIASSSSQPTTQYGGVSQGGDGTILVGGPRLQRLSPGERVLREVYRPQPEVTLQIWPSFLANGRDFVFTQAATDADQRGVFLGSLDSDRTVRLVPVFSNAAVAPSGHLVYAQDGSLLAQRVRHDGHRSGDPSVIVSGVSSGGGYAHFALTADRTLVYVPAHGGEVSELAWYDRRGRLLGKAGAAHQYRQIALAPDQRRLIVERNDSPTHSANLWIMDMARGTMLRVNQAMAAQTGFGGDVDAVWAPDGRGYAFTAWVDEEADLFVGRLDSSDPPVRLAHLPGIQWAEHWSADGRFFLYAQSDSTGSSLWALPLEGTRTPFVLVNSPAHNDEPQLSPDGRWLAYESNETGRYEVYLQPFAKQGERWRLSTDGGDQPKWRADGGELFYVSPDGTMMAVRVLADRQPGQPEALFRTPLDLLPALDQYAVTPDGQRFLIVSPIRSRETARVTLISNWPSLVEK